MSPFNQSKGMVAYGDIEVMLKKLIECISEVFKEEKEKTLRRKLAKIEGDF